VGGEVGVVDAVGAGVSGTSVGAPVGPGVGVSRPPSVGAGIAVVGNGLEPGELVEVARGRTVVQATATAQTAAAAIVGTDLRWIGTRQL